MVVLWYNTSILSLLHSRNYFVYL